MVEDGEQTNEGNDTGTETPDVPKKSEVDKVKDNLAQLKEANDSVEKELLRKEELRAKMQLGGQTEAGQTPEKPKEETDKEYSDRIDSEIREGKFNG